MDRAAAGVRASMAADTEPDIQMGKAVRVVLGKTKVTGTVRYHGETQFQEGTWVGLELEKPLGKNDGSVLGVAYFSCAPSHGVFVRPQCCLRLDGGSPSADQRGSTSAVPSRSTSRSSVQLPVAAAPTWREGEGLVLFGHTCKVRFVGSLHLGDGIWAGVEFDKPVGQNDGTCGGTRYFECRSSHGLFLQLPRGEGGICSVSKLGADCEAVSGRDAPAVVDLSGEETTTASVSSRLSFRRPSVASISDEIIAEDDPSFTLVDSWGRSHASMKIGPVFAHLAEEREELESRLEAMQAESGERERSLRQSVFAAQSECTSLQEHMEALRAEARTAEETLRDAMRSVQDSSEREVARLQAESRVRESQFKAGIEEAQRGQKQAERRAKAAEAVLAELQAELFGEVAVDAPLASSMAPRAESAPA